MKQDFKSVNISGGAYSELVGVTRITVVSDYQHATEKDKNEYDSTVTKLLGDVLLTDGKKIQEKVKIV